MTTPIVVLNAIREGRGKEPINPHHIEGFGGPNDAPSPAPPGDLPDPVQDIPEDWLNPEQDIPMEPMRLPPLPPGLVPRRSRASQEPVAMQVPEPPSGPDIVQNFTKAMFQLIVTDRAAAWRGRPVDLTEQDELDVRRVVLRAIQRDLDADLAAVAAPRRRRRNLKPEAPPVPSEAPGGIPSPKPPPVPPEALGGLPRKRGRPLKARS